MAKAPHAAEGGDRCLGGLLGGCAYGLGFHEGLGFRVPLSGLEFRAICVYLQKFRV